MKYIGKATDFPFKLLVLVLYAEGSLDYVKKSHANNYFTVHSRPVQQRFGMSAKQLHGYWNSLARMGYISGLSFECGAAKFYLRIPSYLKPI